MNLDFSFLPEFNKKPSWPEIRPGDTVRVSFKIREGERERVQSFQGFVLRLRRSALASSFTVRRISYGIGVERTFLVHSPLLEKLEVTRYGRVRRAKLYYLRQLSGRAARIKERPWVRKAADVGEPKRGQSPPS